MTASLIRWVATAALVVVAPMTSATTLSFEDIGAVGALPASYAGLDWSAGGWIGFSGDQSPYTPHSGDWRIALDFGAADAASRIGFGQAVTFQGAWFSGYAEADVTFHLFYQGSQVAVSSTLAPGAAPAFLASGYAGLVDAVSVSSSNPAFYAMDDFSFTAAVPEPETYALMVAGLGAISFVARRRTARKDFA